VRSHGGTNEFVFSKRTSAWSQERKASLDFFCKFFDQATEERSDELTNTFKKLNVVSKKSGKKVKDLNLWTTNHFHRNEKLKKDPLSKRKGLVLPKDKTPNSLTFAPTHKQTLMKDSYFAHETAVIDAGAQIGKGTKIWHFSHVMAGAVLGEHCNLGQNVVVSPEVVLGRNVKVQNNVSIYTGVICEDDVFLGPSMVFTNVTNPRSAVNRRGQYEKTTVGKGASIGANATIVCGHDIGEYAFIGAGAVVTKTVKPYALMVGNPARQIGWMSAYGHRLLFEDGKAVCPESGEEYFLDGDEVRRS